MQLFLLMTLVSSLATFELANGDEIMRPGRLIDNVSSNEDKGVTDFEWESDEELEDESAKYRWMAPVLYDALKERKLKSSNISQISAGSEEEEEDERKNEKKPKGEGQGKKGEEEEERKKKKKPKSESKGEKKKGKKKNKKDKNKQKTPEEKEEEKKVWFDHLGCYKDKGPKAWKYPALRAIKVLYKNLRRKINWEWEDYFEIIMSCAHAAQARGCECFGIQFYGECWCDPLACSTYNIYKESRKCTKGVGLHWANFVYKAKCGSVYGCCPDGAMPAQGPNYEGCPDCTTAVDLVFVVDSSGSIGRKNFKMIKGILIKLIRHFSVSAYYARIGLIKYSTSARSVFHLQQSERMGFLMIEKKITKMRYSKGGTRTGKAIAMALKMLKKSRRKLDGKVVNHEQACIVVTDGLTNAKDIPTFNAATAALKAASHVIAVGVMGKGYNAEKKKQQKAELKEIASSPEDLFYEASFEQVRDHVEPIAKRACPLIYKKSAGKKP